MLALDYWVLCATVRNKWGVVVRLSRWVLIQETPRVAGLRGRVVVEVVLFSIARDAVHGYILGLFV